MTDFTVSKLISYLYTSSDKISFSLNEQNSIIKEVEKGVKKPLLFRRKISDLNSLYVCPNCKRERHVTNNETLYPARCSQCGQRFDWRSFQKAQKTEREKTN